MNELLDTATDLQGGALPAKLRSEINQSLPWGSQRYRHRDVAFMGSAFLL